MCILRFFLKPDHNVLPNLCLLALSFQLCIRLNCSLSLQGISLRSGRFTDSENKRLKENVLDFLALTGIKSTTHLFFPKLFKAQKTFRNKLKRNHKFYEKIGKTFSQSRKPNKKHLFEISSVLKKEEAYCLRTALIQYNYLICHMYQTCIPIVF